MTAVAAGRKTLAEQLAKARNVSVDKEEKALADLRNPGLSPTAWTTAPRAFRIYELEGDELQCLRFNARANFTFRQQDLRDCILVDQRSHLWIWADHVVSTYALKVANEYWSVHRRMNASEAATVVCRGREPDAFKALVPSWQAFDKITVSVIATDTRFL
ncbi:villin headpiece domain-containing protein [Aphelenchoides avenae]|nr:villin headpiece domain-containing protein [Aphelenchus avenae]